MSDDRFCINHQDRLFKYHRINVEKCSILECSRQIPIIQKLCQKCLQRASEEKQDLKSQESYNQSIEQLKESLKQSHDKCKKIISEQDKIRKSLKSQIQKVEQDALKYLDDLFKDLMNYQKNIDDFEKMLEMIGQQGCQNKALNEFYQLTYENLSKFLEGLNQKQPHEFNGNAINFGRLIEKYLHEQDGNFTRFKEDLQNNIHLIGKFSIDIFSEDENVRTFFGSLQYNQIIQMEQKEGEKDIIKNIFIPQRNQVFLNDKNQSVQKNKIITSQDMNFNENKTKSAVFDFDVDAGNQVKLIYRKLTYDNNKLNNTIQDCDVVISGKIGKYRGEIDPQTLKLKEGKLTFKTSNCDVCYEGKFNQDDSFFKGVKRIVNQNHELCYKGYFDYKLQQQRKGCIWISISETQKILKYLGGFKDGKQDPHGIYKSLRRQKNSNNTIFIEKKIFYLQKELIEQLDQFKEVDFDEIDSTDNFKLIEEILNSDKKYSIKVPTNEQQNCLIF